jgi:hypothetical protein
VSKWGVVAVAVAVTVGCSQPDAPLSPAVFTLFDVQALYAEGHDGDYRIAVDSSLPGGIPIGQLMSAEGVLKVHPTWAEGYNAAYVVSEVWTDFDELWVQPAYVPVKGWNQGVRAGLTMPWQPIFSVGPRSRFYSPFWQIIFVDVPDDTMPESLTSAEQVLKSGYPLHPDLGRVMVMYPGQVTIEQLDVAGYVIPAGGAMPRQGWVDGARGSYLEFQSAGLGWDDRLVIDEIPIYHFVARANDGSLVQLPIPTVAGTGPPYSNTPPPFTQNPTTPAGGPTFTSHYAGYWRLYTVVLPPEARVFAPPARPDVAAALQQAAPEFPLYESYSPTIVSATEPTVRGVAGMVALDPTCFAGDVYSLEPGNTPDPCRWLDSQQHIEQHLSPALIQRTNVTVTCPFVSFRGEAVAP